MRQVDKRHYKFERYMYPGRWMSVFHQIKETLALKPKSILEIGAGPGVYRDVITKELEVKYKSLDIAEDLHPDVVGSVLAIPLPDESFDVVVAFQVLEHVPFGEFETVLLELKRAAKRYVIISLPHFGPTIRCCFKIPFLPEFKFSFRIPYHPKHDFNGEHYWEIGKKGFSAGKIRRIIKKHFNIEREFVPFENQYHRFYVLKK